MQWKNESSYVYGTNGVIVLNDKSKIAGFDLDYTLIKTKSGRKFPVDGDDWTMYHETIINKLQRYFDDKYNIVIVTNQGGLKNKSKIDEFKRKIENFAKLIKLPFMILISTSNDRFRKPNTGLWTTHINGDKEQSFYCGDAGGLAKDFSDTDAKFAANLSVKFIHVNELVTGIKVHPIITYPIDFNVDVTKKYAKFIPSKFQEMIINIGYPASGKSYYTKKYILKNNYGYINRDTLRTMAKCTKYCEEQIRDNHSVVIDNTNLTKAHRKEFTDIAKKYKIKYRYIHFNTSFEQSMHNNYYRHAITNGDIGIIPKIVYNKMRKHYEIPTKDEGYYKMDTINFIAEIDNDDNYYKQYFY